MRNIRLFPYIVRSNLGLAPNPFWGILSLNVCKPRIRSSAEIGDGVIGTGAKGVKTRYGGKTNCYSGKLVHAMRVTRIITMEQYDEYCNPQLRQAFTLTLFSLILFISVSAQKGGTLITEIQKILATKKTDVGVSILNLKTGERISMSYKNK